MFLLVHYDDFEDFRELIDYEPYHISKNEDEPPEEPQYVAIKISPRSLNDVPYGIITTKSWDALTFYMGISPTRTMQIPVSSIVDELTESILDDVIEAIELNCNHWADYDTHWDCYCKTEDVCGCDPLHDGW
jgi:hypothetical protein